MITCNRCGKLSDQIVTCTDVYVSLPTHHHQEGFENQLIQQSYAFEIVDNGYLIKHVDFEKFILLLKNFVFNSVEQRDVKILSLQSGEPMTFGALKNYRSLTEWVHFIEGKEVASIIENGRIRTLFQPIVHAQSGEIYGYEALSRGILTDGSLMNPEKLFASAKAMDLLFFLDRVCREASIRAAAKQGITEKLFINFIPTAIYEPSLCLKSTAQVLNEENISEDQVVFEVVETEFVQDFSHLNRILDYYKEKGYSTALDDIGSGFSNIEALLKLKPDYMKIDMNIIHDIHLSLEKQKQLDEFIFQGKKIGLKILAEGVETNEEYEYLKNKQVDFIQGYLFGKPEEVPKKA